MEADSELLPVLGKAQIPLYVELGQSKLSLKSICEMHPGSVLILTKFVGEPLDVYAGKTHIAKCEAVEIDDNWGIRITEIDKASV